MKKTVITYVNTRNNDIFISAEEAINVSLDGTNTVVMILKREDGSEKEVSVSTFKRWYKKSVEEVEVEEPKTEKKQGHSNIVDGERVNIRKDEAEKTVVVRAFTGMLIGIFKVEKETKTTITVNTAKGSLTFDKKTGIQITDKKRFANRIDL